MGAAAGRRAVTKNMVLVLRQQGWVQIFVGEDTGVKTEGFDGWMEPAGKMFDVNNEEQLAQALLIDAAVVREVLGIEYTQGNEQAANGG